MTTTSTAFDTRQQNAAQQQQKWPVQQDQDLLRGQVQYQALRQRQVAARL